MSRHPDGEEGFTLIELMVASAILAVISAVLAAAFVVTLRTTDEANDRLGRAHDVHITTASFTPYVQSAQYVVRGDATPACGPGGAELTFVWKEDTVQHVASYVLQPEGAAQRLTAYRCVAGSLTSQTVVSRNVLTADEPTCDAGACPTSATLPQPRSVSWSLTDTASNEHVLEGTRRPA
ncbi:MAG TPA: prepilin-type N-terminal cleavage/methylation domain-containing protein [Mycobacteriales bacterium]|nr:prepilin-type N-terminal cleavage/methylation domain-containing protein [Mycobacteriales bacterium]